VKKWTVLILAVIVLVLATAVIWPRSVQREVSFRNALTIPIRVTVNRVTPRLATQDFSIRPGGLWRVTYRYSQAELAGAEEHVISVVVDAAGEVLMTTAEFRGADVYGKTLIIRKGMIEIAGS